MIKPYLRRTFEHTTLGLRWKDGFFTLGFRYENRSVCLVTVLKKGNCTTTRTKALNPFKRLWWAWLRKRTELSIKWNGAEHMRCQGCGEGIIKYSIKDPNYKESQRGKQRWLVCEHCVDFYDWHWSKREVKLS